MKNRRFGIGSIVLAVAALVAVLGWGTYGPRQFGGPTTYVTTVGNSMQPLLHKGDLALVQKKSDYRVGDVIAYKSKTLNRLVLHRVVEKNDGTYTVKGDHNSWLDLDHPTNDEIVGSMRHHYDGLGNRLNLLRNPYFAAILAMLIVIPFQLRRFKEVAKKGSGENRGRSLSPPKLGLKAPSLPSSLVSDTGRNVLAGLCAFAVVVVGFISTRPTTTQHTAVTDYTSSGTFEYSADATGAELVYQGGEVKTGDPIYLNIVHDLDVSFTYNLQSERIDSSAGSIVMNARISNTNGWSHSLPMVMQQTFRGNSVTVKGTLHLSDIANVIDSVQRMTHVFRSGYRVELLPVVQVHSRIRNKPVDQVFAPRLGFTFQPDEMDVDDAPPAGYGSNNLRPQKGGQVSRSESKPKPFEVLGQKLPASPIRAVALLLALLSGVGAVLVHRRRQEMAEGDPLQLIEMQYGDLLLHVGSLEPFSHHVPVDVESMEHLARIADHYDRIIMWTGDATTLTFVVEEAGLLHRYRMERDVETLEVQPTRPADPPPVPVDPDLTRLVGRSVADAKELLRTDAEEKAVKRFAADSVAPHDVVDRDEPESEAEPVPVGGDSAAAEATADDVPAEPMTLANTPEFDFDEADSVDESEDEISETGTDDEVAEDDAPETEAADDIANDDNDEGEQ